MVFVFLFNLTLLSPLLFAYTVLCFVQFFVLRFFKIRELKRRFVEEIACMMETGGEVFVTISIDKVHNQRKVLNINFKYELIIQMENTYKEIKIELDNS